MKQSERREMDGLIDDPWEVKGRGGVGTERRTKAVTRGVALEREPSV